jgi:hypothetical protein
VTTRPAARDYAAHVCFHPDPAPLHPAPADISSNLSGVTTQRPHSESVVHSWLCLCCTGSRLTVVQPAMATLAVVAAVSGPSVAHFCLCGVESTALAARHMVSSWHKAVWRLANNCNLYDCKRWRAGMKQLTGAPPMLSKDNICLPAGSALVVSFCQRVQEAPYLALIPPIG